MQRLAFAGRLLFLILALVACGEQPDETPAPTSAAGGAEAVISTTPESSQPPTLEVVIPPTPTEIPPSPTPSEPLAALVNEQPILLSEYEKELARYEQARAELGITLESAGNTDYRTLVLNALLERALITQAAATEGLVITPQMVEDKLEELRSAAQESGNFEAWLEANQWTEDEFRVALASEMLTERIVARVTADVPFAVEQVRARYIQVDDLALAQALHAQLLNGDDFASLARQHSLDRVTGQNGGDLGFFAQGSLLVPAVEAAAFALQPGEVSEVIAGDDGDGDQATYYLVQVIERDPQRPLTADMRYALLQQAFESWLQAQWDQANIIRFVDTGS